MAQGGMAVMDVDGLGNADVTSEADAGDAAVLVRRMANQHGCSRVDPGDRPCRHRNHRRDADLMGELMHALGLDGGGPIPPSRRSAEQVMAEAAPPRDWEGLLSGVLRGAA